MSGEEERVMFSSITNHTRLRCRQPVRAPNRFGFNKAKVIPQSRRMATHEVTFLYSAEK